MRCAAVQDAVLSPGTGDRRRVVLATSVAESVPDGSGVRVVVDSGLAREPRVDHAGAERADDGTGLAGGRTAAGGAGRARGAGRVYRCWTEAEDVRLPRYPPAPEIKVADLTAFALQAACWGDPGATGLALLHLLPGGAMAAARSVLSAAAAADASGRSAGPGVRMSRLGLRQFAPPGHRRTPPPVVGADRAAEAVALLSQEPPREYGDDLAGAWRLARRGGDPYASRWRTESRRLRSASTGLSRATRPGQRPR